MDERQDTYRGARGGQLAFVRARERARKRGGGKQEDKDKKEGVPPPAMVARTSVSSSSSPRMASWRWRGVMRFTRRSLDALPKRRDNRCRVSATEFRTDAPCRVT